MLQKVKTKTKNENDDTQGEDKNLFLRIQNKQK